LCPEYSLEENYWIHVELFPGTASQYSANALNELQVIFLHARAGEIGILVCQRIQTEHLDVPTSETLTFPYTVEECEEFINLLEYSKGVFR